MSGPITTTPTDIIIDVTKVVRPPDMSGASLGKPHSLSKGIIRECQLIKYRNTYFRKCFKHFHVNRNAYYLHFITVSCDMLYFVQRYFNNPRNITRLRFAKKFVKLIGNATIGTETNITIEKSRRGQFVHAHIILYCEKKKMLKIVEELKNAFTNEHLILNGKQNAVKISEKDYATIHRAIKYFLGQHIDGTWKHEFLCFVKNFSPNPLAITQDNLPKYNKHGIISFD